MTLVLGCITESDAVMVSDRRLTDSRTGRPVEENRNKALILCGHFTLGYTGLADIEGMPTDQWLAEILVEPSGSTPFQLIAEKATEAFGRIKLDRRARMHSFLALGWAAFRRSPSELQPGVIVVSNYLGDDGQWLPEARNEFVARRWEIPPGRRHLLSWVGQALTTAEAGKVNRYLDRIIRSARGTADIARLLAWQLRIVAARNRSVGSALLLSSIPKRAVSAEGHAAPLATSAIDFDEQLSLYVPEGEMGPVRYGPAWVCTGLAIRGVEVWTEKPPWWKE